MIDGRQGTRADAMSIVLDAYAARSCPLKTVNAFSPSIQAPELTRVDPPFFRDSRAIEASVFGMVGESEGRVVDLRDARASGGASWSRASMQAMASGADVIIAPLLPRDETGHRTGRPSMLVRADGEGHGYRPVQLKFHRVMESGGTDDPLVVARLGSPRRSSELVGRRFRWNTRLNAALQVAHYWRLLQACGYAAPEPWGGLIGIDRLNAAPPGRPAQIEPMIAWLRLDQRCVPPNPRWVAVPAEAEAISPLERYDSEHRYRVDLAQAALGGTPPGELETPILSSECRGCVWQQHCRDQLDVDDLSARITKTPLDVHELRTLRGLGVATVSDLARADLPSLTEQFLPAAGHRTGGEARLQRAYRRAQLLDSGVELERQTTGPLDLPRHALEIDIDIETSADDRLYLWGFWVDDPEAGAPYARQFGAFTDLDADGEAALAVEALRWLRSVVGARDAAVYHYSDYETIRLARLAPRLGELGEWATGWAFTHFVDLFPLMRRHFFGANGLGLKAVVRAATDFAWRDADPGGLNSQSWFAEAIGDADPDARTAARRRVLEYNEDDVRATWHLRRWLRSLT